MSLTGGPLTYKTLLQRIKIILIRCNNVLYVRGVEEEEEEAAGGGGSEMVG